MKVKVNTQGTSQVVTAGIQGPAGSRYYTVAEAQDVDVTSLSEGSLLVYKASTAKWTAQKSLEHQDLEGGQY